MLSSRLWRVAAAAAASALVVAQHSETPGGQSTFISPGGDVSFAFTVPHNGNTDVFFTMRAHVRNSWVAVGLGSDDMKGALFLMLYRSESGDNVTFSPRLAYGNYESAHYPDLRYQLLPGTGVVDDHMVLVVKCIQHCRSWPAADSNSGYIDVSSPNQKAIYALGPRQDFGSDDPAAGLRFHREFGVFTIDMKRTQGSPDAPDLDAKSKAVGTSLDYHLTGMRDLRSTSHRVIMLVTVIILFPLGVAMRRLGSWARWHGLNQTIAVVGTLIGLVLGVLTSFHYQRSRGFRSAHQILGFVVIAMLLGQLALGFTHDKRRRANPAPTKLRVAHVWLGRTVLLVAMINAFLGLFFARNPRFGLSLALFVVAMAFALFFAYYGRKYLQVRKQAQAGGPNSGAPTGYQSQPWRAEQQGAAGAGYPADPPPGYEPPSQHIGLQAIPHPPAAPSPWKSSDAKDYEGDPALGGAQRPREFA